MRINYKVILSVFILVSLISLLGFTYYKSNFETRKTLTSAVPITVNSNDDISQKKDLNMPRGFIQSYDPSSMTLEIRLFSGSDYKINLTGKKFLVYCLDTYIESNQGINLFESYIDYSGIKMDSASDFFPGKKMIGEYFYEFGNSIDNQIFYVTSDLEGTTKGTLDIIFFIVNCSQNK